MTIKILEKSIFTKARKKPARHVRHLKTGKIVAAGSGEKRGDVYQIKGKATPKLKEVMHKLKLVKNVDNKIDVLESEIARLKVLKTTHLESIEPIFKALDTEKIKLNKFIMSVSRKEFFKPVYKGLFTEAYQRLTSKAKKEVDETRDKYRTLIKYITGYIKIKKSEDTKLNDLVDDLKKSLEKLLKTRKDINKLIINSKIRKSYTALKKWNQPLENEWPSYDPTPANYPDEDFETRKKPVRHARMGPTGKPYFAGKGAAEAKPSKKITYNDIYSLVNSVKPVPFKTKGGKVFFNYIADDRFTKDISSEINKMVSEFEEKAKQKGLVYKKSDVRDLTFEGEEPAKQKRITIVVDKNASNAKKEPKKKIDFDELLDKVQYVERPMRSREKPYYKVFLGGKFHKLKDTADVVPLAEKLGYNVEGEDFAMRRKPVRHVRRLPSGKIVEAGRGAPRADVAPRSSPWGQVDQADKLAEGVWDVGTPGHGGVMVRNDIAKKRLSPLAQQKAIQSGGYHSFEEDVDWAIPYLQLGITEKNGRDMKSHIITALSGGNADILAEAGIEPNPEVYAEHLKWEQSNKRRAEKDPNLIVSAIRAHNPELTEVWTADDKKYLVRGYAAARESGNFDLSAVEVITEIPED